MATIGFDAILCRLRLIRDAPALTRQLQGSTGAGLNCRFEPITRAALRTVRAGFAAAMVIGGARSATQQ